MKKITKRLIGINFITYISNFLFMYYYAKYKGVLQAYWGLLGIWGLSPLVLLLITSPILADDYKKEYKIFKPYSTIDWIMRAIACFLSFYTLRFQYMSLGYIIQNLICLLLLIVSLILEYRMLKKAKIYADYPIDENIKKEEFTLEEKQNVRNMARAQPLALWSFIMFFSIGLGLDIEGKLYILLSILLFVLFLMLNYIKCYWFFIDEGEAKNTFIKDSIYAVIGYSIYFVLVFVLGYGIYKFWLIIFAIGFFYPTIRTNRKMAIRYKQLEAYLGDNLLDYFYYKK
ncbi:hypothetical protein [Clostridium cellulovorans]|uniref:Uncharacterized protein n=1 Tax=Clostridium cellulovorans (strain ATCC 35296 / DSM 3052 / OCM 3 / 743B) TaxID=573061 RepID=D9SQS5_CLOC7|nr:hypothetical protein [Clostridium cellulovorans]ADL52281.1 hypothetical protein Clocel_2569 [Clostridium cellulovorans 743B]